MELKMKSYRALALKEVRSQKLTSFLILIAVILSAMMTTAAGQSVGVLSAMRQQQAVAIGGNRYSLRKKRHRYWKMIPACLMQDALFRWEIKN